MSTSPPEADTARRPGLSQAVTGVVPPQTAEAVIRTTWPSVTAASTGIANFGRALIRTIFLAPFGWMVLAPLYFKKVLPFLAMRYRLTNRRLMIMRGLKGKPREEVALAEIDEVRLVEASFNAFYKSADLEVVSGGKVVLTLKGVRDPESFRQSVLIAVIAWVPGKHKMLPMIPASESK